MKGGMQTTGIKPLYCKCGKATSKTMTIPNETEISIHFTRKSTYWHITKNGKTKRVFQQPKEWK